MGLNKSTGNMYSWLDATWNAVKGKCPHECVYCYMNQERLNPLRLDKSEFKTDLNEGQFIFVGSSTDMFAQSVPEEWIREVLAYCSNFDRAFLFQSKNPKRIYELEQQNLFPKDHIIATTLETNRDMSAISKAPSADERAHWMGQIAGLGIETTVTIEPVMQFDLITFVDMLQYCSPSFISIGSDSKHHNLPEPSREDILILINQLQGITRVEKKSNLARILK